MDIIRFDDEIFKMGFYFKDPVESPNYVPDEKELG